MAWGLETWSASQVVTAAEMTQGINANFQAAFPGAVSSTDWDPSLEATTTNPSVSVDGMRYQIGALEFLQARFVFSAVATPYGDGTYFVTLPNGAVGIHATTTFGSGQVVGTWQARDDSAPTGQSGSVLLRSSGTIHFNAQTSGLLNSGGPWIWAAGDVISFNAVIPIA